MPDFTTFSDRQILDFLAGNYEEIGAGLPPTDMVERFLRDIQQGSVGIEKRNQAFAIVVKANRPRPGPDFLNVQICPRADLSFMYVQRTARGGGIGTALLDQVKLKYMENQGMELVCAGEGRKKFFERGGFSALGLTEQGLHYMVCPPLI